eukprot:m.176783 g.176783  ORF g.176783 m.176783 type:complete len:404 (+) comp9963_c0_seq3:364-1575(+)
MAYVFSSPKFLLLPSCSSRSSRSSLFNDSFARASEPPRLVTPKRRKLLSPSPPSTPFKALDMASQSFDHAFFVAAVAKFQRLNPPESDLTKELCIATNCSMNVLDNLPHGFENLTIKYVLQGTNLLIINLMPGPTHGSADHLLHELLGNWIRTQNLKHSVHAEANTYYEYDEDGGRRRMADAHLISNYPQDGTVVAPCFIVEVEVGNCGPLAMRKDHLEYFASPNTQAVLGVKIFNDDWGAAAILWQRDAAGAIVVGEAWLFGLRRNANGSARPMGIREAMMRKFEERRGAGDPHLPHVPHAMWRHSAPPVPMMLDRTTAAARFLPEVPFTPVPALTVPANLILHRVVTGDGAPLLASMVAAAIAPNDLVIDLSEVLRAAVLGEKSSGTAECARLGMAGQAPQ